MKMFPSKIIRIRVLSQLRVVYILLACQATSSFALWGRPSSPPSSSVAATTKTITELHATTASAAATSAANNNDNNNNNNTKLERGKILPPGKDITAKDLYQAYTEVQQEYQDRAFSQAQKWKVLNVQDDVEIAILQHDSDPACPYVRMKAIMPVSVQECWDFLLVSRWDETMPRMDPFYEGVSTHGEYYLHKQKVPPYMILCRKRTKRILAFGKRDLVFVSVQDTPLKDGTWVSGSVSVVTSILPRYIGYTRAFQDSIAFYKPIDNNTKTELTIVCRIDLNDSLGNGGAIPMWLYVKTIGLTGVKSITSMRNALIDDQKERQQRQRENNDEEREKAETTATADNAAPDRRRWWGRKSSSRESNEGSR